MSSAILTILAGAILTMAGVLIGISGIDQAREAHRQSEWERDNPIGWVVISKNGQWIQSFYGRKVDADNKMRAEPPPSFAPLPHDFYENAEWEWVPMERVK